MKKYFFLILIFFSKIFTTDIENPLFLRDIIGKEIGQGVLDEAEFGKSDFSIGELVIVKRSSGIYSYGYVEFFVPNNTDYLKITVGYDNNGLAFTKKVPKQYVGKLPLQPIIWPILSFLNKDKLKGKKEEI